MKVTGKNFGCMDPGIGGKAKAGILPDLKLFSKSGIGCEERDLPDIPYSEKHLALAVKQYQALEDAGIHEHLLGIKADPKWVKANPVDYEDALKNIVKLHRKGVVAYMIGREPSAFMNAATYAGWLMRSREILADETMVFANAPCLGNPQTYRWFKTVIDLCYDAFGDTFVDVFGMAWHTQFGSQLWGLMKAVQQLRQMLPQGMPLWMVEGGTWGSANKAREPHQTDAEQAMANLALASHAFNLGIEKVFFGFQDTLSAQKEFYGYGMVDAKGNPKLLYKWLQEYIADMNRINQ